MLYKRKDQNKIGFLENSGEKSTKDENEFAAQLSKELDKKEAEAQRAKKLNNKFDPMFSKGSHIASANTSEVTDIGGPKKQIKTETANTIFDNNKIARLIEMKDNKTITLEEKADLKAKRQSIKQERMDNMVEALKDTDQSKASSVSPVSEFRGSGYNIPKNSMSIFDTADFERLPEKTAGESVSDNTKERRSQKDESWKNSGKSVSSKDIGNDFLNNLITEK